MKAVVGDMIDRGVFSEAIARRYMLETLAEWVGDRQDLVIPQTAAAASRSKG